MALSLEAARAGDRPRLAGELAQASNMKEADWPCSVSVQGLFVSVSLAGSSQCSLGFLKVLERAFVSRKHLFGLKLIAAGSLEIGLCGRCAATIRLASAVRIAAKMILGSFLGSEPRPLARLRNCRRRAI